MNLYQVICEGDEESYYVLAASMADAIAYWQADMVDLQGGFPHEYEPQAVILAAWAGEIHNPAIEKGSREC